MYRKVIKYTDYNGNEREEPFYFNMNKAEIVKWQIEVNGGLKNSLQAAIDAHDQRVLTRVFDDMIRRSYGEKSPDGKYFMKNEEILNHFTCTEAYSVLFMELGSDDLAADAFVKGILPEDMVREAEEEAKKQIEEKKAKESNHENNNQGISVVK